MAVPYLPSRDADLLTWSQAFSAQVTATPTAFGLVAGQATTLAGFVTAYASALALATNDSTRTRATVALKDTAKANLLFNIRTLVAVVQGYPAITPTQLSALGLTVRSDTRTPIDAPATSPLVSINGIVNYNARIVIADENTPSARRRPFGVVGMQLWTKAGGTAPVGIEGMTYAGLFTRTPTQFTVEGAALGQLLWMRGTWVDAKGQTGPLSPLVSATVS